MTGSRLRAVFALPFAALLLLTACASNVEAGNQATPEPSPSEMVNVEPPASGWDITCDEVMPASEVQTLGISGGPMIPPQHAAPAEIPVLYYQQTVGGFSCAWGDPEFQDVNIGWLVIDAIPEATEQWQHPWRGPGEGGATCDGSVCVAETLTSAGDWVVISAAWAPIDQSLFQATAQRILDALEAAPRNQVMLPDPLVDACEQLFDPALAADVIGTATPLGFNMSGGGWSFESAAKTLAGLPDAGSCGIDAADNEYVEYVGITWLPEAAWAFDESGTTAREAIELPGALDDTGYTTCDEQAETCSVSFLVNGSWFVVAGHDLAQHPDAALSGSYDLGTATPMEIAVGVADLVIGAVGESGS